MDDFLIDIRQLIKKGRRNLNKRVGSVQISTPTGITFILDPHDPEVTMAKKILIYMRDRRVLKSQECCDDCIDRSLESLQKIRGYLVERQQELANLTDGSLFLMTEFMLDAVRQFITYAERIEAAYQPSGSSIPDLRRSPEARERYFTALKRLREHCWQTLAQISHIAKTEIPEVPKNLKLDNWTTQNYVQNKTKG
jgi:hypothetical protein